MKNDRKANQVVANISGAIGETTPLFTIPLGGVTELIVDMANMTYINSIGVKNWIMWTVKIPKDCTVRLLNCPFVIVSQAATVMGFTAPNMFIESFRMPYLCESCNFDNFVLGVRGKEFDYSRDGQPSKITLPTHLTCPKCKQSTFEPDFLSEKTFKFLT